MFVLVRVVCIQGIPLVAFSKIDPKKFRSNYSQLSIFQGAINLLLAVYKKEFRALGGYLTDASKVNDCFVGYFTRIIFGRYLLEYC